MEARLAEIAAEKDVARKNFLVAELVTERFRIIGCDPVVVGGSAVEFYTDGQYVSGDVDICQAGIHIPTHREREEVMTPIAKPLGSLRKWSVCGVFVDVLGSIETSARTPFRQIGGVKIIQIEDLIPERILIATVPTKNEQLLKTARILLSVAISGAVETDFEELIRVADCANYRVGGELRELLREVTLKGGLQP